MYIEMIINWISGQLSSINVLTVLTSIGGSWILREFIDWRKNISLQKQYAKMQQDLEVIKVKCQQEIQTHYLKTQLEVTSKYKIYPELSSVFREACASIHDAFFRGGGFVTQAQKLCCFSVNQIVSKHFIFLDEDLLKKCIEIKDALIEAIVDLDTLNEDQKKVSFDNIGQQVDALCNMIRAKLIN